MTHCSEQHETEPLDGRTRATSACIDENVGEGQAARTADCSSSLATSAATAAAGYVEESSFRPKFQALFRNDPGRLQDLGSVMR